MEAVADGEQSSTARMVIFFGIRRTPLLSGGGGANGFVVISIGTAVDAGKVEGAVGVVGTVEEARDDTEVGMVEEAGLPNSVGIGTLYGTGVGMVKGAGFPNGMGVGMVEEVGLPNDMGAGAVEEAVTTVGGPPPAAADKYDVVDGETVIVFQTVADVGMVGAPREAMVGSTISSTSSPRV